MNNFIEMDMPKTLNLPERAELALNAMINVADEDYEYIPFFSGFLKSDENNPAWMSHGNWDYGSSHGRLTDSIILVREMTGSTYGEEIEQHYHKNLLSFFKSDGLCYRRNNFTQEQINSFDSKFQQSASMIDQRAVILGLGTLFKATGDEEIKMYADKHVAALKRIARKERESWYYPGCEYTENGWPSMDAVVTRLAYDPCAMWGRQVNPLIRYYKFTNNQDAFELAENFVSNIIYRSGAFNSDGSFNGALEYRNGHFHTRMGTLNSIANFADFTKDSFLMNWVKRSYDWALTKLTSFGWTPGDMHDQGYEHETCTLVDAIGCAITLAKNGYSEYWSNAEKFLRNHLVESQLTDTSWIFHLDNKEKDIKESTTYYKVGDRLKGAFAGYSAPNDFVYDGDKGRGHIMDVQTCCVASGGRGLYNGFNNIVTEKNGRVSVNMLLNKAAKSLIVQSYLPHIGKVILTITENIKDLACRIPEWVHYGAVKVAIKTGSEVRNETGRSLSLVNKTFIKIGEVFKGQVIEITFPMAFYETKETAVDDSFSVKWAGDDVIGITPKGTYQPLYENKIILKDVQMQKTKLYYGDEKDFD